MTDKIINIEDLTLEEFNELFACEDGGCPATDKHFARLNAMFRFADAIEDFRSLVHTILNISDEYEFLCHFRFWNYLDREWFISFGIFPEFFLAISISFLLAFLVIIDYKYNYRLILLNLSGKLIVWLSFLTFLLMFKIEEETLVFHNLLSISPFSNFIKAVVLTSLIFSIIISFDYLKAEKIYSYEYFILYGLAVIGMLTLISANDLITMYLGIEIQSLSFYVLAATKVYNNFSTEAGLKYFILGAFASGLLLLGCSYIYGTFGTTNLESIYSICYFNDSVVSLPSLWFGISAVIIAILFKIGAAPFHMWLPDVYEGVPTAVTAFFSIVPKIGIFALFVNLTLSLFSFNAFVINNILMYSSVLSILIGTFGALYQTKLKRLLAYSAISHVGFWLLGFYSLNAYSFFSVFFYIVIYIVISINIFTLLLTLRKRDNNLKIKKINELVVLFKSNPLLAINFAVILFSIAGIPPLAGFYSKLYVFISAIKTEIYLLAILAAIFSVAASLYYIRLIKLMFFRNFEHWAFLKETSKSNSLIIAGTCIVNIFFFCYPEIFILYIYNLILELVSYT